LDRESPALSLPRQRASEPAFWRDFDSRFAALESRVETTGWRRAFGGLQFSTAWSLNSLGSQQLSKSGLVTIVPHSSELFQCDQVCPKLSQAAEMQTNWVKTNRRRQDRIPAVVPVRVRGRDSSGISFEALAHTLDLTSTGTRLGSIHHNLKALDTLTIVYHQRRMEFTVVWIKLLEGNSDYQVGLQAF
jgi:hypothetical protein